MKTLLLVGTLSLNDSLCVENYKDFSPSGEENSIECENPKHQIEVREIREGSYIRRLRIVCRCHTVEAAPPPIYEKAQTGGMPPWASTWLGDHWIVVALLFSFTLWVIKEVFVGFLRIFYKRAVQVTVNVDQPRATADQIQDIVRTEVRSTLTPRRSEQGPTRFQALSDD